VGKPTSIVQGVQSPPAYISGVDTPHVVTPLPINTLEDNQGEIQLSSNQNNSLYIASFYPISIIVHSFVLWGNLMLPVHQILVEGKPQNHALHLHLSHTLMLRISQVHSLSNRKYLGPGEIAANIMTFNPP
jgi:hypothetical protein